MSNEHPGINPASSATPLYLACVGLRDAWTALRADEAHDPKAPYSEAFKGSAAREHIWDAAQLAAVFAVDSVLDHLRALSLSYEPAARAQKDWPAEMWPGVANYTAGRAVLEGCALAGWFFNPAVDAEERLRRGTRILLWSLSEELKSPNPPSKEGLNFWRSKIEECDMRVRNSGRRWGIEIDGVARYYSHQAAIDDLVPTVGREIYHEWSGLAHYIAWAFSDWGSIRVDDEKPGLRFAFRNHEDRHFILIDNVAAVVTLAGTRFAQYFGRSANGLLATYEHLHAHLQSERPHVENALREKFGV